MRLLQTIFSILWGLGYLGNGVLFLYVEWSFLRQNFVQVFNPLLQFQVLGVLLTTPFFWVFLVMAVVGQYAATRIERYFKQGVKPTKINVATATSPPPQTFKKIHPIPPAPYAPSKPTYAVPLQPFPERPYISFRIDELERTTASEWNNEKRLSEIHYELEFRSRKKALDLRERVAVRLTQLQVTLPPVLPMEEGLLSHYGYKVGINGLSESKRWEILSTVFLRPLLPIDNTAYLNEWGEPNSAKRLQKLANSIAAFTRLAKGRNRGNFSKAIQDWETDLAYLKRTYYNNRFSFQYPRT